MAGKGLPLRLVLLRDWWIRVPLCRAKGLRLRLRWVVVRPGLLLRVPPCQFSLLVLLRLFLLVVVDFHPFLGLCKSRRASLNGATGLRPFLERM
jgi:hypothetical protein